MQTTINHMADVVRPERVMKSLEQGHRVTHQLIASTDASQLGDRTPCKDWDVRALINHLCQINLRYAAMAAGTEFTDEPGTDYIGDDAVGAFSKAERTARWAFAQEGMLDRIYPSPWGDITGAVLVQHCVNEHVAHAWDLAKATGYSTDIVPEVAEEALTIWRAWFEGDVGRNPEMFEPEKPAPDAATPADRVAAYLGRAA